jgi:aminotransferase EvaB
MSSPLADVPFNALGRSTAAMRDELDVAIGRVLTSGWFVLGPEHDAFESELASYLGTAHAVAVANGTDALQLALQAAGVGEGDLVLTAANAGGYTSTATLAIGAVPVYADVDASSLLLTVATIEAAVLRLGRPPRALVVTHLFGAAADILAIVAWARPLGIVVVEDCAQSLGARAGDAMAGSVADVATTSFYPTKNLGALGDGGAVLTSDDGIALAVRELRQYGWRSKYRATRPGGRNSRLDELQAAVLRAKLPHLDVWNDRRRQIHRRYEEAGSPRARLVNTSGPHFAAHLAVLEVADRDSARAVFDRHGIRTDVHYPIPDHRQEVSVDDVALPVTEAAAGRILSIPLFPELTDDEVERVCRAVEEAGA